MGNDEKKAKRKTIQGKYGTYQLGSAIGRGGNGTVYSVSVVNSQENELEVGQRYVLKELNAKKEERIERFHREIKEMQSLKNSELDIIPVLDSYLDTKGKTENWYLMPYAKQFKYEDIEITLDKLKMMRALGNTISKLHQKNICHRDIKPANILVYKNKCCLSDFGLVWDVNLGGHLTNENEPVGPIAIRPPEMEYQYPKPDNVDDTEYYKKVDVYLFVKTVWIVLTNNSNGFRGEYNRTDPTIYLDKKKINLGKTLEPLHQMMQKATLFYNVERISIDACLQYIDYQIQVAENSISQKIIDKWVYEEQLQEVLYKQNPDEIVFTTIENKTETLQKLKSIVDIIVVDGEKEVVLGRLKEVKKSRENVIGLVLDSQFNIMRSLKKIQIDFYIEKISIARNVVTDEDFEKKDTGTIFVGRLPDEVKNACQPEKVICSLKDLMKTSEQEVFYDGEQKLLIRPFM